MAVFHLNDTNRIEAAYVCTLRFKVTTTFAVLFIFFHAHNNRERTAAKSSLYIHSAPNTSSFSLESQVIKSKRPYSDFGGH